MKVAPLEYPLTRLTLGAVATVSIAQRHPEMAKVLAATRKATAAFPCKHSPWTEVGDGDRPQAGAIRPK